MKTDPIETLDDNTRQILAESELPKRTKRTKDEEFTLVVEDMPDLNTFNCIYGQRTRIQVHAFPKKVRFIIAFS